MVNAWLCALMPSVADSTVAVNVRLLFFEPARGVTDTVTVRLDPSVIGSCWLIFLVAVEADPSMAASAGANSMKNRGSGLAGAVMSSRNLKFLVDGPCNALKLNSNASVIGIMTVALLMSLEMIGVPVENARTPGV